MTEKNPDLEGNVDVSDLSSISLDSETLDDLGVENSAYENKATENSPELSLESLGTDSDTLDEGSNALNDNLFLDRGEDISLRRVGDTGDNLGKYLRIIFFSWVFILLGGLIISLAYSFSLYIKQSSQATVDENYEAYVSSYKEKLKKAKELIGIDYASNYQAPKVGMIQPLNAINNIINATDLDYIDKKDLLSNYVSDIVNETQTNAADVEKLKEKIAKQGFLPAELEILLSDDQAIDTIQRSLNALEVVKFSTATKVFSYMNTALMTISEMIRMNSVSVDSLKQLFNQINLRGEKDISSYVYMCYLNPFETNANCDMIGDLDLYYSLLKDDSINIKLFKNAMNAINQLLENSDSTLFSITFNGFNAQQKNISFNIEVYTNQEDERVLLSQGQRNPNIFILTNIINLLKQSSFIIGAEINTKEINVETKTVNLGNVSKTVNYSSMDFTVPIQKDTEREIFDYIDFDNLKKIFEYKRGKN